MQKVTAAWDRIRKQQTATDGKGKEREGTGREEGGRKEQGREARQELTKMRNTLLKMDRKWCRNRD